MSCLKVFDIGASLSFTHNEHPGPDLWWVDKHLVTLEAGKVDTKGGKIRAISNTSMTSWLSQDLQTQDYRIVHVVQTMPTIDLLDPELREQLANLHESLLSFNPPIHNPAVGVHPTWDDVPHALKTMSKVLVRSGHEVNGLSAVFTDGSRPNEYGAKGIEHQFELRSEEYISDVIVWDEACAVQLVTTKGRFSPHFGGSGGTPKILSSKAGVLARFAGRMMKDKEKEFVGRIQTIWRHDIPQAPLVSESEG
ncbi:hypothetical protein FRC07_003790 [Ceratobasidium sp. 392]|nr:hypothetical protein FRC07_003790 [Ceratobasidium sp. 392]